MSRDVARDGFYILPGAVNVPANLRHLIYRPPSATQYTPATMSGVPKKPLAASAPSGSEEKDASSFKPQKMRGPYLHQNKVSSYKKKLGDC
jgi:hypothetical protein